MDTKELETLDPLHYSAVDVNGGLLGPPFLCPPSSPLSSHIEGEFVVLAPHCQVSDLLPVGYLIIVGDQAYHRCVISKLDDGVGVVHSQSVVGEQGVLEGTKHTPLRGPRCCLPSPSGSDLSRIHLQRGSVPGSLSW